MNIEKNIKAAEGEIAPDLVLSGDVFSVFSGEVFRSDVAVKDDCVVGVGEYSEEVPEDLVYEFDGVVIPGLIDAHMHVESSFLTPAEFSRAVVPYGTTSVIADPHEIANVAGVEGIKMLVEMARESLVDFYFLAPSCVPANSSFESYGGSVDEDDIRSLLGWEDMVGLGELMDFEGVLNLDSDVIGKLKVSKGYKVDGHSPGLRGRRLDAYLNSGADTDHECVSVDEVEEKVRKGMKVVLREGSASRDLGRLVSSVNEFNHCRFLLGTDDLDPIDIMDRGHMDHRVRLCIQNGIDPEIAVKMSTINTASHYGLDIGAVAPGYKADLVVVDNLSNMDTKAVFKDGELVWEEEFGFKTDLSGDVEVETRSYVDIPDIRPVDLSVNSEGAEKARVVDIHPDKIVTGHSIVDVEDGLPDPDRDIAKVAVIDRHGNGKHVGLGFVRGFGIEKGALASTVAHDSHNCISIGIDTEDMLKAINRVGEIGGGLVVVNDGETTSLPLPIAGLISDHSYGEVIDKLSLVRRMSSEIGVDISHPFMKMSFLSLPVIPELRITDFGLVDVVENQFINLWID